MKLHSAAEKGDVQKIRELLAAGKPVDQRDPCGDTALLVAARQGHEEAFFALLAAGADPHAVGYAGESVLHRAARSGNERIVRALIERGAEAVTGAERPDVSLPGWFYRPTVLAGDVASSRIEEEEIFGPVVTVQAFRSEDEAVRLANASPFGLGASVWTRDPDRARRVASRLEAGMVLTNDVAYSYGIGQAPWGGVKRSGFGRTHGKHGLYEATRVKFVESDRGRLREPWWFPYDRHAVDGFRAFLGMFYGNGIKARAGAAWPDACGRS